MDEFFFYILFFVSYFSYICKTKQRDMNRFIGNSIIILTILAQFFITKSFGGNFFPESPAELGLDVLSLFLFGLGIYISRSKRKLF